MEKISKIIIVDLEIYADFWINIINQTCQDSVDMNMKSKLKVSTGRWFKNTFHWESQIINEEFNQIYAWPVTEKKIKGEKLGIVGCYCLGVISGSRILLSFMEEQDGFWINYV